MSINHSLHEGNSDYKQTPLSRRCPKFQPCTGVVLTDATSTRVSAGQRLHMLEYKNIVVLHLWDNVFVNPRVGSSFPPVLAKSHKQNLFKQRLGLPAFDLYFSPTEAGCHSAKPGARYWLF